jgi:hypothetical protein
MAHTERDVTDQNIRIGKAQVDTTQPSHTAGVHEGNTPGNYDHQAGHHADGTSDARRSTGVNADQRNPLTPDMPNLSPP